MSLPEEVLIVGLAVGLKQPSIKTIFELYSFITCSTTIFKLWSGPEEAVFKIQNQNDFAWASFKIFIVQYTFLCYNYLVLFCLQSEYWNLCILKFSCFQIIFHNNFEIMHAIIILIISYMKIVKKINGIKKLNLFQENHFIVQWFLSKLFWFFLKNTCKIIRKILFFSWSWLYL